MNETLINKIEEHAISNPDKIAIAFKKEQLSYKDLDNRIKNTASRLKELGVNKGDFICFSAVSKPETIVLYLGLQYIGAIAVFVDKDAIETNTFEICKDCGTSLLFTDKPIHFSDEKIRVYPISELYIDYDRKPIEYNKPNKDDLARLIYTSGTTGKAKGCMYSYKAIRQLCINMINAVKMDADDIVLIPLPLNHNFAIENIDSCLYLGATVVLQDGFAFAKEIEDNIINYECNSLILVPAAIEIIEQQMQEHFSKIMSRFKRIVTSTGPLSINQRKRIVRQLPNTTIYNVWGSSETGLAIISNISEIVNNKSKIATLGKPANNIQVKITNNHGKVLQNDHLIAGTMAIKSESMMSGYLNMQDQNNKTIVDGWFLTNDIAYQDSDGYLYLLGRADDIINVGGKKVYPLEIENVASRFHTILECSCVGFDDPSGILGQVPVLFVVTKNGCLEKNEFREYLALNLEHYKIPVDYVELPELPKNTMKKVDKSALKLLWVN